MTRKLIPYIVVIVLGLLLFGVKRWKTGQDKDPGKHTTTTTRPPSDAPNRSRGFDRRISYLEYSEHAKCRMKCRHISQAEVEEIMKEGKINYKKSDLQNARCPRYALEGLTRDQQRVRVIYAQCDASTAVVTVIDLNTEWECHCPGDHDNYENRN